MFFTFKTHAELEHNARIMEATPRRFIVLEEPMNFNYLNLKNELYTENVKQVLTYDEEDKPIKWLTCDNIVTSAQRNEAEIILTHSTYDQFLSDQRIIEEKY